MIFINDQNFRGTESEGLDDLCEVIIGPACDAPVTEDNIEVVESVVVVKVMLTKGARTDDGVSFLSLVLLRNGRLNEIAGFNEFVVPDLDEDIARLDI